MENTWGRHKRKQLSLGRGWKNDSVAGYNPEAFNFINIRFIYLDYMYFHVFLIDLKHARDEVFQFYLCEIEVSSSPLPKRSTRGTHVSFRSINRDKWMEEWWSGLLCSFSLIITLLLRGSKSRAETHRKHCKTKAEKTQTVLMEKLLILIFICFCELFTDLIDCFLSECFKARTGSVQK